jgi:hypothetical protein
MDGNISPDDRYEWNRVPKKNSKINPMLSADLNNPSLVDPLMGSLKNLAENQETGIKKISLGNNSFKNAKNPSEIQPAGEDSFSDDDQLIESNEDAEIQGLHH